MSSLKGIELTKDNSLNNSAHTIANKGEFDKKLEEINEKELSIIFDSIIAGVVIVDAQTHKITDCNLLASKLIGLPKEEIIGKLCNQFIYPAEEGKCPVRDLGQGINNLECVLLNAEGKKIHILKTVIPITWQNHSYLIESFTDITELKNKEKESLEIDERYRALPFFSLDGQIKGFIEMIENIDKRKKVVEALRKSEERFRIAAKTASDLIRELDIETGRLEWYGDVAGKLGYKQDEFPRTQEAWESIIHPDDYPRVINELEKHLKEGQPYNTEYRVRSKDGDFLYWSDSVTTILDREGKPDRMIGVCSDITDRKYVEQEQEKILQQLEKANEELSSFGYIVSHDLKAPLRGVKVLVDWICKDYMDKIDEEGRQKLDLLVTRVDRMHNLIDGILQYSKIGRLEEEKSQVNLKELMPDIIDMVSPPENIEIIIENELPVIECARIRIAQVFQNLLSNAIKYMDKPHGLIKIGCIEEQNFWKFSVKDNGPGIAEKYFEKIFQMYQTLTPRDEYESTGVGLTVVKKIVDLYGGKIWIESQVGQGCTFIFTIPKLQEQKEMTKNEKYETNFVS